MIKHGAFGMDTTPGIFRRGKAETLNDCIEHLNEGKTMNQNQCPAKAGETYRGSEGFNDVHKHIDSEDRNMEILSHLLGTLENGTLVLWRRPLEVIGPKAACGGGVVV